jgi:multicomponent Na+:H+ antiporter subunit B
MLFMPDPTPPPPDPGAVERVVHDSGVPNAVCGIIFRNRLYDTVFEVVVFTIAIMGARFLLEGGVAPATAYRLTDQPSVVLARLGATIAAVVGIELAIRGHLSPGGGFAAGVAGGTAIGLVAITSSAAWMRSVYRRWHADTMEKVAVIVFITASAVTMAGLELPKGERGALVSGGIIPVLSVVVAVKVALGSWAVTLLFIARGSRQ